MRLRLLWIIACTSMVKPADAEEQKYIVEIDKQLSRAFVQGRKKEQYLVLVLVVLVSGHHVQVSQDLVLVHVALAAGHRI
ncbi:hypothetical protein GQ600_379 [Phytophthora cactorum]|nr:hypothetical protein GQ600_379 [Phytophthora cactorum]